MVNAMVDEFVSSEAPASSSSPSRSRQSKARTTTSAPVDADSLLHDLTSFATAKALTNQQIQAKAQEMLDQGIDKSVISTFIKKQKALQESEFASAIEAQAADMMPSLSNETIEAKSKEMLAQGVDRAIVASWIVQQQTIQMQNQQQLLYMQQQQQQQQMQQQQQNRQQFQVSTTIPN